MAIANQITLGLGVVTAVVALIGYWANQHIKRRETKSQMYAAAIQAIHEFEELPYIIRHRKSSGSEVRAELAEKLSGVFSRIKYHQTLLNMDSPVVGQAYTDLFTHTRRHAGPHRKEAWNTPPVTSDDQMPGAAYYPYDNSHEIEVCLLAMRRELNPWGWLSRPFTHRRIRKLRNNRPPYREPEHMRQRRAEVFRNNG
ncbi:hypothetical protein [Streptomyces sp. NPDC056045]|uniref:hypothetical protein n=1 Tax=Streptomyces sp. NPDC056045 TaxID=3345691 RepID=UPI0035D75A14